MHIRKNSKSGANDIIIELDKLSAETPDTIFGLLPDEIMLLLIHHVPHDSLPALRLVNRRFHTLCDDYLFNNHALANIRWRLRFFRGQDEDLQDDLEEESERYGCRSSVLLLVIGVALSVVGGAKSNKVFHDPDATHSTRALFLAFMLASLMLLLLGIIRTVKYWQSTKKIHAIDQQIDDVNDNIENDLTRLNAKLKSRKL